MNTRVLHRLISCAFVAGALGGVSQETRAETMVWSGPKQITSTSTEAGGLVIELDGSAVTTNSSCTNTFVVDVNDPSFQYFAPKLETAYTNSQAVEVQFDPAETACQVMVMGVKLN